MFIPLQTFSSENDPRYNTDLQPVAPESGGVIPPAPSLRKKAGVQTGFQTPGTETLTRTAVAPDLASRWNRLKARLTDSGLLLGVWFLMELGGGEGILAVVGGLAIIAIFIYQIYLLGTKGQTIGKQSVNIKVVKTDTGNNGGFVTNVLLREIVNWVLGIIPLYSLVDVLFIFREDQRCIHDFLAGTRVVNE